MDATMSAPDLWMIPLEPPPPGVQSNFNQPSDMLGLVIAILSTMLFLTLTILALRFWAIWGSHESWKLDDYCAVATFILTIAAGSVLIPYTRVIAKHNWNLSLGLVLSDWDHRMVTTLVLTTNLTLFSGKITILALYHRIFANRLRYQILITFTISLAIPAMGVAVLAICVPRPGKPWRSFEKDATTLRLTTMLTSVFSLVVDVMILVLPIPILVKLKLSRGRKAGVLAIFATGLLAVVASIIATYYRACLFRVVGGMRYTTVSALCLCVEASTSVIISSMPSAAKVWKRHIVGSSLYFFFRSKFPTSRATTPELPLDIREAKEKAEADAKRKRRGLFSLPSLLMGNSSTTQSRRNPGPTDALRLDSRAEVLEKGCPTLNDPSGHLEDSNAV